MLSSQIADSGFPPDSITREVLLGPQAGMEATVGVWGGVSTEWELKSPPFMVTVPNLP